MNGSFSKQYRCKHIIQQNISGNQRADITSTSCARQASVLLTFVAHNPRTTYDITLPLLSSHADSAYNPRALEITFKKLFNPQNTSLKTQAFVLYTKKIDPQYLSVFCSFHPDTHYQKKYSLYQRTQIQTMTDRRFLIRQQPKQVQGNNRNNKF